MQRAIENEGVPAEISQTAGTFVCNHVFFALMHQLQTDADALPTSNARGRSSGKSSARTEAGKALRGGFIHVPYLPEQGTPNMALADMVRGLRTACACALTTKKEIGRASCRERV